MVLGGFGFQSRLRGLSIDNLVEAEMVLADGRIVTVNEQENPDLWWAIRGAGPSLVLSPVTKPKPFLYLLSSLEISSSLFVHSALLMLFADSDTQSISSCHRTITHQALP